MSLPGGQSENKLFAVYLLMSYNVKYKGRIYIGFTVNPERRVRQHNRGRDYGAAKKTSGKGPWQMIVLIHGFPNEIAALRFEWAWQNPKKSRMLKSKNVDKLRYKGNELKYRLRVMNVMLNTGPWYRLPLIVNIISTEHYAIIMGLNETLPSHMKIMQGTTAVQSNVPNYQNLNLSKNYEIRCYFCQNIFEDLMPIINCINDNCNMTSHIYCLARYMLQNTVHIIPTAGTCPSCMQQLQYGELISKHLFVF